MEITTLTPGPRPTPTSATARRRGTRALVRTCSLLALVLAGLLGPAATASAHADLLSTTPGDQEQLRQAPAEVTLTFSRPVGDQFASVTVTGPDGQTWQDGDAQVSGESVVQPLRALAQAGSYRTDWRVVAEDGHVLEGTVSFVYAPPEEPASVPAAEPPPAATQESAAPVTRAEAQPAASTEEAGAGPDPVVVVVVLAGAAALLLGGAALARRRAHPSPRG